MQEEQNKEINLSEVKINIDNTFDSDSNTQEKHTNESNKQRILQESTEKKDIQDDNQAINQEDIKLNFREDDFGYKEGEEINTQKQIQESPDKNDWYESYDHLERQYQQEQYAANKNKSQNDSLQPNQRTFTKLQQSSRKVIQMQEQNNHQKPQQKDTNLQKDYEEEKEQKIENVGQEYDIDKISKFRVAFVSSILGEADALYQYINGYLCDRRLYIRDWQTHFKITSFITQWLHLTVPKLIQNFQSFNVFQDPKKPSQHNIANQFKVNHVIPCGSYSKLFSSLLTLLDQSQEIYNCRYSNNSSELLQKMIEYNHEKFKDKCKIKIIKEEILVRPPYNVSIFFINTILNFGQSGGFDLLTLAIFQNRNNKSSLDNATEGISETQSRLFNPSFYFLSQVVDLIYSFKEFLTKEYYQNLVIKILQACLSFSKNKYDKESLRHVNKKDLVNFINKLEKLSNGLVFQENLDQIIDQENQGYQTYQMTELIELELALRCLRMPILEKKFIGHSILSQKINQVLARQINKEQEDNKIIDNLTKKQKVNQIQSETAQNQYNSQIQRNPRQQKWIDKEFLIDWMDKNLIFNMIFGESLHPEIIKKSYFLIEFLYKNGKINEAQIDLMWKCAMQKHEVYRIEILKALIFLASKAEYKELREMLRRVHTTPLNNTDKFIMLLLKTIAQNISRKISGVHLGANTNFQLNQDSRRMRLLLDSTNIQQTQKGKQKGGQRRMSDVGIQQSKKMEFDESDQIQMNRGAFREDFKMSPWDDHDIQALGTKNGTNLQSEELRNEQIRNMRNRSSSQAKQIKNQQLGNKPDKNKEENQKKQENDQQQIRVNTQNQIQEGTKERRNSLEDQLYPDEESNLNITDVPADKEDKKTADQEYSPKQQTLFNVDNNNLFDNDSNSQDHFGDQKSQISINGDQQIKMKRQNEILKIQSKINQQEEEKMESSHEQNQENKEDQKNKFSIKQFLYDIHIYIEGEENQNKLQQNQKNEDCEYPNKIEYKKLAIDVLKLMWSYCMEDIIIPPQNQNIPNQPLNIGHNQFNNQQQFDFEANIDNRIGQLSQQMYQTTIDTFCQVINREFPLSSFFFMNLCVQNFKRNLSVISSQRILQKLIEGTQFPILALERDSSNQNLHFINQKEGKKLPKNQEELIIALDNDLKITNECLSSYVEFKRNSVQLIFEQFGELDNEILGGLGGEQDENLETQSSLDNNTNHTEEERSRFSQSIISSTQKSDTADYLTSMTRSHQKSNQKRRAQEPLSQHISKPQGERGQSFSKIQSDIQQQNTQEAEKNESQQESCFSMTLNILEGEPSSSSLRASSKIVAEDLNNNQIFNNQDPSQIFQIKKNISLQNKNEQQQKQSNLLPEVIENSFNLQIQNDFIQCSETINDNIDNEKLQKKEKISSASKKQNEQQIKQKKQTQKQQQQSSQHFSSIKQSPSSQSQTQDPSQINQSQVPNHNRQFLNSLITNRVFNLNFIQEMTQRIDFFKFLTKYSSCKTFKQAQINILWECLIVNAFNEEERDQFFVLCSELLHSVQQNELKQQQKMNFDIDQDQQSSMNMADALLFEDDCFEIIFFEILLKLDYRSSENSGGAGFTINMYNCFEKFFMYVNESYGQIETKSRSRGILNDIYSNQIQIVIYDHQLIGIEALWEIILGAQDERIYKKASQLLMKLFKNFATEKADDIVPNIKELFFQNCMNQIKAGLRDIDDKNSQLVKASHFSPGQIKQTPNQQNQIDDIDNFQNQLEAQQTDINIGLLQNSLLPDLANSASIDESRNRISRSINLLSQFITDFEGVKGRQGQRQGEKGRKGQEQQSVTIVVSNQISNSRGPQKIDLCLPPHTKIQELKDQIGKSLLKQMLGDELTLLYRGKEMTEELKTLKDLGMRSHLADGKIEPVKFILTLKSTLDFQQELKAEGEALQNQAHLMEGVDTLKIFLDGLNASDEAIKLALKKCKLNLDEAILMLTNPEQVIDLEEELRFEREENDQVQIMTNKNQNLNLGDKMEKEGQECVKEEEQQEDIRLSEMISNRSECFDLLINLLNLGITEITQASWSLLSQVPINQQLLSKIRLLDHEPSKNNSSSFIISQENHQNKQGEMSQIEWSNIIDPESIHKMLYSLQLVNQLITINNEKLTELEIHERFNWRQRFLELGGFHHLYYILICFDFEKLHEQVEFENQQQVRNLSRGIPSETSNDKIKQQSKDCDKIQKKVKQKKQKKNGIFKIIQAKCLAHLVSIIKIFLQAAILSDDEKNLLNLIASSSTSPFKKSRPQQNQLINSQSANSNEIMSSNNSAGESHSEKDTSSQATAKFANSFSQIVPLETAQSATDDHERHSEKSFTPGQNGQTLEVPAKEKDDSLSSRVRSINRYPSSGPAPKNQNLEINVQNNNNILIRTQVDDFPKLIEQMSQGGLAKRIIQSIDFASFITKLLQILEISTSLFSSLDEIQSSQFKNYGEIGFQKSHETSSAGLLEDPDPILIQNCLDLLLPCLLWDPQTLIVQLYEFKHFERFLIQGLLKSQSERIRKSIETNFKTLCYYIEEQETKRANIDQFATRGYQDALQNNNSKINENLNPKLFLLQILFKNLPRSMDKGRFQNLEGEFYEEYFNLLSSLIRISKNEFEDLHQEEQIQINKTNINNDEQFFDKERKKFDAVKILIFSIDSIKLNHLILSGQMISSENKKPSGPMMSAAERQLCGYLQLCQSLLEVLPQLKEKAAKQCNLIALITDFILHINSGNQPNSNIQGNQLVIPQISNIKNQFEQKQLGRQTRKRAFGLLLTLCEKTEVNYGLTLKILYKFYEKVNRSWQFLDLKEFDSDVGIKQSSGYVGLKNFGCTCYMNSLLQQLYMIPDLRKEILNIDMMQMDSNIAREENLLFQLQSVFANLQESEKSYFTPKGFVNTFKFYGEPVNVRVQQDTHEFYNVLCDQIEQLIPKVKTTKSNQDEKQEIDNFLKRTIGGTLCNQTKSLESAYPYVGEREEDFYAITLDIKNKKTIQEALDLYIKPDVLEGDNKYHCEQYDKNISAQRRSYLKDLSNTVAINLKRFEFDYNTMRRLKVNDYCEFPQRINFKRWTKEGILEQEQKDTNDDQEIYLNNQNVEIGDLEFQEEGKENLQEDDEEKNDKNLNFLIEDTVGGEQMDQGIDFNDDEIQSDDNLRFKRNENKFIISQGVITASGGSANSKQRRVRSSNKKRSQERLIHKQQITTPNIQIGIKKRAEEHINLSRELSDQEKSPLRNQSRQVKSIGIRDYKTEKDQAIIDEDAYSQDAKSVNSMDSSLKIKQDIDSQRVFTRKPSQKQSKRVEIQGNNTKREQNDQEIRTRQKSKEKIKTDKYEYQLVGVLVHSGSADAGHYYSFIMERNKYSQNYGKWFEFNDTIVKQFDIQNLKKECFGGQGNQNNRGVANENNFIDNDKLQYRLNERCCNAYLIFYERVEMIQEIQSLNDHNQQNQNTLLQILHQQNIFNKIHQQNQAFKHLKLFSDGDFVKFMKDYINLCNFTDVLYFPEKYSESAKMASQRELTEHYVEDWGLQMKKALRYQETQELKGENISPVQIQLSKNYFQEYITIKQKSSDADIFGIQIQGQDQEIDIGLKTIQMATILAQDLILKLKDTESFVQLLQKLNQMYQSHAQACVWFIKWITEEDTILQEILLASNYPEVRESFAHLMATTFGITIMNEEKYLIAVEHQADFECDQKQIERGEVSKRRVNKSAALRLVKLFIHRVINQARVYWHNFDDFFILLKDFAQSHFQVAAYLIQRGLIGILLEFIMNNKLPFYSSQGVQNFRMGDSVSQPNFQHVYSLFSYLIKCCLTKGINAVKHYSPYSVFQEENKSIMLPEDNIAGFLTPECIEEIIEVSQSSSEIQNQSVEEIIGHLSWGDIKVSQFFLQEFIKHIRLRKGQINSLQTLMNPIQAILRLDDNKILKKQRVDFILNFGEMGISQQYLLGNHQQFRNSQINVQNLGLINFLYRVKETHPIYLLLILNFIGKLAVRDSKDLIILEKLREVKNTFQDWVWIFLHRIADDSLLSNRAKQKFNIQLVNLAEQTIQDFGEIFELKEISNNQNQFNQKLQENEKTEFVENYPQKSSPLKDEQNLEQINKMSVDQRANDSIDKICNQGLDIKQEKRIYESINFVQSEEEEESIFKLISEEKSKNQQHQLNHTNQIQENPRVAVHNSMNYFTSNNDSKDKNDYLDSNDII